MCRTITLHWGMLRNAKFGPEGALLSPCNSGAPCWIRIPGLTSLPSVFPPITLVSPNTTTRSHSDSSSSDAGLTIELPPKWIAGFSAGEISFNLTIETKSSYRLGKRPRVGVSLPQDGRDLPILEAIQNYFGCGYIVKDSGDRAVWIFRCDNPEELETIIVPFFDQFNLVSSKNLDFQDMKKALQMIRGKEHLTPEGLAKIQEIHAQMNLKRDRSTIDHGTIEITEDWLRGFVDAEGSFYSSVTPNKTSALGYRVIATLSITQTVSEKPVLEAIKKYIGCGFIKTKPAKNPGGRAVCEYQVNAFKDILNVIIPFFNANPLLTTKNLNYQDL